MSNVRVTYSGLISLVIGLITAITGLIFVLIITRSLTPSEFGTWGLIGGLITYVIIIEPVVSFWVTREIARDVKSAKTAIVSSTFLSVGGTLAYIIIAYFVSQKTDAEINVLIFAALMIPFMFLNRTLTAINIGWKPQAGGYGLLGFEVTKIPAALIFIYFLDMGVNGIVLSLIVGYIASSAILAFLSRSKLRVSIKKEHIKKWLKLFWVSSYIKFTTVVVFDVLIFSLITGSVVGLAYWTAAMAIAILIRHTGQLTKALYPKLLGGGKKEYLQENLNKILYFAFPFVAFSIVFSRPGLFALNPAYELAYLVVVFLTLRAFIRIIHSAFNTALQGIEKVDVYQESTYKDYLKSKLFYLPTLRLFERGTYLGTLTIVLILLVQRDVPQLELVIYWSIVALVTLIPFTVYLYVLVRRDFTLQVDMKSIIKYFFASTVVFGITWLLMEQFLTYQESIFEFLPNLFMFALVGILGYMGLTYLIDNRTRNLFKAIKSEMMHKDAS